MDLAWHKEGLLHQDGRAWGSRTPLELLAAALLDLQSLSPWLESFQEKRIGPQLEFLPHQVPSLSLRLPRHSLRKTFTKHSSLLGLRL